ncbi:hypothetical protein VNO80_10095 [Phaseolus coccineus]|uniref:Uncharacterized protein n=1 Tax=Phaseolus coccineus TaxID=3886 RepID=A0AAN9RJ46_PHACN
MMLTMGSKTDFGMRFCFKCLLWQSKKGNGVSIEIALDSLKNRRVGWKTKQLEKEDEALKKQCEEAKVVNDVLNIQNQELQEDGGRCLGSPNNNLFYGCFVLFSYMLIYCKSNIDDYILLFWYFKIRERIPRVYENAIDKSLRVSEAEF